MELVAGLQEQLVVVGRVAYAMLLAGLIGYERELAHRPAGLRTHVLVAGAVAFFVGLSAEISEAYAAAAYAERVRVDPIRLIDATVTAIAFLGAGTIFRSGGRNAVVGLTTAAGLLVVGAIGVAVGLSQYVAATAVALLAFVVLRLVGHLEGRAARER